jgi:hypothetical protein
MTTTVAELRAGLATNLATISGLRTSAFIPDNPSPPIAIVVPQRIDFDQAMGRGMDEYSFDIVVIANRMSERTAQTTLDGYCNPSGALSVKTALEIDKTLGGKAFDLRVTDMSSYTALALGETTYLAATFSVTVIAS